MERRYTTVTTVTTVTVAGVRYRIFNFTSEHESGYAAQTLEFRAFTVEGEGMAEIMLVGGGGSGGDGNAAGGDGGAGALLGNITLAEGTYRAQVQDACTPTGLY